MKKLPIISAAIMVRNEEANLERCLKSILPIIDEIVILDTGSTDKTVEIAKKYTKKVFFQPWQDNFALHRNEVMSHVTGDWFLQIDADEEVIFDGKTKPSVLPRFLAAIKPDINACGIRLMDWRESKKKFVAQVDVPRLLRTGKCKYHRRIHNEVDYEGVTAMYHGFFLKHYGYDMTPEQKKKKADRTIRLLHESLKDDPKDYKSMFYLAQAYASFADNNEEGLRWAEEYIKHKDEMGDHFNSSVYFQGFNTYWLKGDMKGCKHWLDMGLAHDPHDPDLCFSLMRYGIKVQNHMLVNVGAGGFLKTYENLNKYLMDHPGKFVFNNNHAAYATALYYFGITAIENGFLTLSRFQAVIDHKDFPESVKKDLWKQMPKDLDSLGKQVGVEIRPRANAQTSIIVPGTMDAYNRAISQHNHQMRARA